MNVIDALRKLSAKLVQLYWITRVDAAYGLALRVLKIGIELKRNADRLNKYYEDLCEKQLHES